MLILFSNNFNNPSVALVVLQKNMIRLSTNIKKVNLWIVFNKCLESDI